MSTKRKKEESFRWAPCSDGALSKPRCVGMTGMASDDKPQSQEMHKLEQSLYEDEGGK